MGISLARRNRKAGLHVHREDTGAACQRLFDSSFVLLWDRPRGLRSAGTFRIKDTNSFDASIVYSLVPFRVWQSPYAMFWCLLACITSIICSSADCCSSVTDVPCVPLPPPKLCPFTVYDRPCFHKRKRRANAYLPFLFSASWFLNGNPDVLLSAPVFLLIRPLLLANSMHQSAIIPRKPEPSVPRLKAMIPVLVHMA